MRGPDEPSPRPSRRSAVSCDMRTFFSPSGAGGTETGGKMRASMPGWVPGPFSVTVSEPHAAEPSRTASRMLAPAVGLDGAVHGRGFLSWFRRVLSAVTGLTQERAPRYVGSPRVGKVGCRAHPPVSLWFDVHVSPGSVDDQTYVVTIEERCADVEGTRMHGAPCSRRPGDTCSGR